MLSRAISGLCTVSFGLALIALPEGLVVAQTDVPPSPNISVSTNPGVFAGKWTYRSYLNNPDKSVDPNGLLFGQAEINIAEQPDGMVTGTIGGDGWSLNLTGKATYSSNASVLKVQGVGTVGGETWVYDYFGYLAPSWSIGVNQKPAILGTVIRTLPHSGGQAKAGVVASFLAVKQ
jgi:hypothetical protein